jgi:exonuclease III
MNQQARHSSFKVAHINVRSLAPKIAEIGRFSHRHNLDVVALQETWLVPDQVVATDGYTWVGKGRVGGHGGGVGFLISDRVVFRERPDLLRDGLEASWIEVFQGGVHQPVF